MISGTHEDSGSIRKIHIIEYPEFADNKKIEDGKKMVRFHSINKVMTAGTILLFISLIILATGALLHNDKILLAYTLFYGGLLFGISLITLLVGVIIGAKSGRIQQRADEIFHNKKQGK